MAQTYTFGNVEKQETLSLGNVKTTISITLHMLMDRLVEGELKGQEVYQFMKLTMMMNETFRQKASGKLQTLANQLLTDLRGRFNAYDMNSNEAFLVTEELYNRYERLMQSFDKLVADPRIREVDFAYITDRVMYYLTVGEAKARGVDDDTVVLATNLNKHVLNSTLDDLAAADITVATRKAD